jgi:CubicO group peptidase (beta-lactamase class C family)
MRDREKQVPMTLDTRFRMMSMTKPVTSVAVLMLYEEGRFHLDDPVSKFLPEFADARVYTAADPQGNLITEPAKRPITIRHLLTHTSGLGYAPGYDRTSPLAKAWNALNLWAPGTLADKSRALAGMPLYSQPGEQWRYSYADDVLGRLVEVVSGMPFDRFLQTRLFDPLGMRHTGFIIPEADLGMLATVYKHDKNGDLVPSELGPFANPSDRSRWPSGGAGLISTAGDYLRFAQMLANGGTFEGRQYLSPVTVALMTSNQVPADAMADYWGENSKGLGYGLGVAPVIDASSAQQAGFNGDFSWGGLLDTHWIVSPRTGLVAVLLCQVNPAGNISPQRTYVDFRNQLFATVATLDPPAAR